MATNYELLVKQRGRWTLEAQFASHQRQAAIDEAKELAAQSHIEAAKVVRSTIGSDGLAKESTIYNSDRQKTGRLDSSGGGGGAYADMEIDLDGPSDFTDLEVDLDSGAAWHGGDGEDDAPVARSRARAARPAPTKGLMGPEALVLYKLFIIIIASLGFAALVTYVFLWATGG